MKLFSLHITFVYILYFSFLLCTFCTVLFFFAYLYCNFFCTYVVLYFTFVHICTLLFYIYWTQLAMRSLRRNTFWHQKWSSTLVDLLKLLPSVFRTGGAFSIYLCWEEQAKWIRFYLWPCTLLIILLFKVHFLLLEL